ncbi:hypothetical protein LXL04_026002 [Taraxacum kok-saghyz]
MTTFYLSGDALSWYKYIFNNDLLTTWDAFTKALETRFGPSSYDNHPALFKLRQTTTVTAYLTEFERLSNCITGLPPDALLNCFLSGLRTDISQELAVIRPTTITQAIGLAKLIEDKNSDFCVCSRYTTPNRWTTQPSFNAATTTSATPKTPPVTPLTTGLLPTPTKPNPTLPFTRLSPEAMQQRRAAGLCFRCPEKYHLGHKCSPPQFFIIVDNEEPTTPDVEPPTPEPNMIDMEPPFISNQTVPITDHHTFPDAPQFLALSPAALLGSSSPRALRVTGYIAGHPITVLVDCGSTHNIVQPRIAQFLYLPTTTIPSFSVMIGNGTHIHCHGYCPDVQVTLQAATFTIPFFVLPIEGADAVLDMQWLGSLGPIQADFSVPQITFTHHHKTITLAREHLARTATPSSIHHLFQKQSVASMHTLLFEPPPTQPNTTDPVIQIILQEFQHIFNTPLNLPPN